MGNNTSYEAHNPEFYRSPLAPDSTRDSEHQEALRSNFQKGWGLELRQVRDQALEFAGIVD